MTSYVDFVDSEELVIKSVFFNNPPDPELYPNQGVIEEDDPRYIAFLSSQKPTALEAAQAERDRLLFIAALRIAPLQDAVDLDDATVADEKLLRAWKEYRVALNRQSDEPGYPINIVWPIAPS